MYVFTSLLSWHRYRNIFLSDLLHIVFDERIVTWKCIFLSRISVNFLTEFSFVWEMVNMNMLCQNIWCSSIYSWLIGYHWAVCSHGRWSLFSHIMSVRTYVHPSVHPVRWWLENKIRATKDTMHEKLTTYRPWLGGSFKIRQTCWIFSFRWLLGFYNYYTVGFINSWVTSFLVIFMERPSRRPLLAIYVANVVSNVVCYWLGNIKQIPIISRLQNLWSTFTWTME